jgi:agmatine/peptidylarginine deiminase
MADHGQLVGDDTDGHIDTIVRMAPNDTLLYIRCDDPQDEQYADFMALEAQLQTLRTREGKPYRLIPLPMPAAMYDGDDRLPATYANFVIINHTVIVPTYNQPSLDAQAVETIAQAFPSRRVVGIDASTVGEAARLAALPHHAVSGRRDTRSAGIVRKHNRNIFIIINPQAIWN